MQHELRKFLSAIQFFTRLPVPAWVGHAPQQLESAARYLPLVGMLVGMLAAAALWLAAQFLPLTLAVALSMAAGILLTGAFHEDGLSDFADGWGGGNDREKTLDIMKDSRVGAYGVIALVLALLVKYQALLALCGKHSLAYLAAALVAAHAISRLMAASIMLTQRYARNDASARASPAAGLDMAGFAVAAVAGVAALGILFAAGATVAAIAAAMAAALLVRAGLAWQFKKRLGGYTGDCLGALQQLAEIAFYLGLLATI